MLVGIHKCCKNERPHKFKFQERYEAILDYNGISHIRLDANEPQFWQQVSQLDLFIYRWEHHDYDRQIALTIIPIVENVMGIKCFPNMATCWCFDDKIREALLLKQKGFPMIESWVFWNKTLALNWVKTVELPVVFKLKSGAGSNNVILIRNKTTAIKLIRKMFGPGIKYGRIPAQGANIRNDSYLYHLIRQWGRIILTKLGIREDTSCVWERHKDYVLFQKFLPNNDFDTRVTVIGNRAFAFRRFNRKNDFRSSGSGLIDYDVTKIDVKCIKKAFAISQAMNFQSMAYDFLYDDAGEPQFSEISYTYVDTAVYNCPGFWDSQLDWHKGHYWPQYFHLLDALNLPDLKQPKINCE